MAVYWNTGKLPRTYVDTPRAKREVHVMATKSELSACCRRDELTGKLQTMGEVFPCDITPEERRRLKPDDMLAVIIQDVPEGWRPEDATP